MKFVAALLAGVGLLLGVPHARAASPLPTVRVCTGAADGNYEFSGEQIAQQASGVLKIVLVSTKGSLDNLAHLEAGDCDAAMVQNDAYVVYKAQNPRSTLTIDKGRALYPEYVHLICNKHRNLGSIRALKPHDVVLVGPNGSGSAVTWAGFKMADPQRFGKVPTLPIGGIRALDKVQEGSEASCMLFVTGLKAPEMLQADRLSHESHDALVLVNAYENAMLSLKDSRGNPIYRAGSIPTGTYPTLQPAGWFSSATATVAVESIFIARDDFINTHPTAYDSLLRAVNNAMPAINQRVNP